RPSPACRRSAQSRTPENSLFRLRFLACLGTPVSPRRARLNVPTGARAAVLLPTAKATRPQRQHEPGPFGCRDLGLGPAVDRRGGRILILLSDLTWLIGAMRLMRGSRACRLT